MNQFTLKPTSNETVPAGQVCPLPGKGGMDSAKGAMGSAVITIIL